MFVIQNKATGRQIDSFRTYGEAAATLERYEAEDKADNMYEENYYKIVEV